MLEKLACMAWGARLGGYKAHADQYIDMGKRILRNLVDTKNVTVAIGAYTLGMYITTIDNGADGYFYLQIAKGIANHSKHEPSLQTDDKAIGLINILNTNFDLHHIDLLNTTRKKIVDSFQGVLEKLSKLTIGTKPQKLNQAQIVQLLWAAISSTWFGVAKLPFYTKTWGAEKADMLKLSEIEHTALTCQLKEAQEVLVLGMGDKNPLNVKFFKILIASVYAIVNLAGDYPNLALEGARNAWFEYDQCSNVACFPGSYFIAYNCCFVAIRTNDVKLFMLSFRNMISLSNLWRTPAVLIKALYDEAESLGYDLSSFSETMAEIVRTKPTNMDEYMTSPEKTSSEVKVPNINLSEGQTELNLLPVEKQTQPPFANVKTEIKEDVLSSLVPEESTNFGVPSPPSIEECINTEYLELSNDDDDDHSCADSSTTHVHYFTID
eukprot:CAMPEP_0168532148 /NCGR_PEP_ID=MMETSP0405-20121227/16006_1 /TAXON_ID=498012 /ORGANISM="Trichosphaerium sp, Strain Am-I-7 wt" /LENGTH=436 /DNA_ID=CAMNT_0008557357 /DNA_START=416 /DNA_END=1726 /DNA_ORIENTATION=-